MTTALALFIIILAVMAALAALLEPVLTILFGILHYLQNLRQGPIKTEPFEKK